MDQPQSTPEDTKNPFEELENQKQLLVQKQKNWKKKARIISMGIVFLIVIAIIAALVYRQILWEQFKTGLQNSTTPSTTPISSSTPIQTASSSTDMSNWKTYTNSKYGLSFHYPPSLELTITNDIPAQFLINLKNSDSEYSLDIGPQQEHNIKSPAFISRLNPVQTLILNGNEWTEYPASSYCDAGMCGETSPGFLAQNDVYNYTFLIVKQNGTSNLATQILSTFQFNP